MAIKRVVIADDSEMQRKVLEKLVNQHPNLQLVGTATNGQEGVALCQMHQPDLFITDVLMPVMTGDVAARLVKENGLAKEIILATSQGQQAIKDTAEELGAGLIIKPFKPQQFFNLIKVDDDGETERRSDNAPN